MEQITVLLIDDHRVVRQGLRDFLELQPDIEVVGEAGSGEEGVELARELLPDVVLMDLVMPGIDGVETTRRLKAVSPSSQVIVLTSFADDNKVFPAIKAGAISYLLKDISPEELAHAVRAACRGEAVLHPDVAAKLMQEFNTPRPNEAPVEQLTPREMDVLRLVAKGMSNKEIADTLIVSEKTVKTHISNILSKLHLADRTQVAIYALRKRLVPIDDEE
ncbi:MULTISPECIES: response regulator [Chloroflexus]|uniref:DNA-binding response regulator n=1 Tax=Chloroflexus islandicus TaxID=1707952 RepID=A0A178M7Z2_9CHLR|nr:MULTISPECIES: response regulator transcription factor [Chloroflexus]MCS6888086.1 response regulator transcription factor [Chloroflexus sp.]MCX7858841.1 response regulator transcription factor [Chloroflexus sp.]MDW8402918.1 response regulator transcription factor [Chloroflexus sp.]OAN44862.1 DNA-binding response regulator [Chloroflexus islandicus]